MNARLGALSMLLLAAAAALPPAVIATPAAAQASCTTWVAEEWEDEGGPVLTAAACALEDSQVYLSLTCYDGQIGLRYDLALNAERLPDLEEVASVVFASEGTELAIEMSYEEMDGKFAASMAADAPLIGLLRAGKEIAIRDSKGLYPSRTLPLNGSGGAIRTLIRDCG